MLPTVHAGFQSRELSFTLRIVKHLYLQPVLLRQLDELSQSLLPGEGASVLPEPHASQHQRKGELPECQTLNHTEYLYQNNIRFSDEILASCA